jgi:hypothetical protein
MSYMDTHAAFAPAGGIQELSFDEIRIVSGGEAPNYSLTRKGPQLDRPSAESVVNGANAFAAVASGVAAVSKGPASAAASGVAAVASGVAALAAMLAGKKPNKDDNKQH